MTDGVAVTTARALTSSGLLSPPAPLAALRLVREVYRGGTNLYTLLGIAAAVMFFSDKTPFPGYAALLPCLGAALVIWSGSGTAVARALSFRPMVFIGLISYSLYLWHWPLIVFAKLLLVQPFTPFQQLLLIGLATGLSVLTWRFVETPFRRRGGARLGSGRPR